MCDDDACIIIGAMMGRNGRSHAWDRTCFFHAAEELEVKNIHTHSHHTEVITCPWMYVSPGFFFLQNVSAKCI